MLRPVAALLFLLPFAGLPPGNVILRGTAQDCFEGKPEGIEGVAVTAYQLGRARTLLAQLKRMERAKFADGDTSSMSRFEIQYTRMISLVSNTPAAARALSDSVGKFSLRVAAKDSVLVVGYEEVEDAPFYYGYAVLGGSANRSFVLDMSRGGCAE
jgi:hypothetical protein